MYSLPSDSIIELSPTIRPIRTLFVKLKTLKSKSPKDADILIFPTNGDMGRMVIVDNYETLKKNRDSIGAIYIKKGRTQIIFVKERLENDSKP